MVCVCEKQLNFAFNFVLYFVPNTQFRRIVRDLVSQRLCMRRRRHRRRHDDDVVIQCQIKH